ncbi:MAG: S-layer homology domain-containing protein [Clostridiales bacterium]|jgi:hypothetical protein|nr:S-layer homology domain-containing protein [Clostridiales bacterium]
MKVMNAFCFRKLAAYLTAIAVVLHIAAVSAAYGVPADIAGTQYERPAARLTALGILSPGEGDFFPEKEMTRAEFTAITLRLCGYSDDFVLGFPFSVSRYTDVRSDMWYAPYIESASELGMASGVGGGRFEPDSPILYAQAVKLVVDAMGYAYFAEQAGGYPAGFLSVASDLRILSGLGAYGDIPVKRGEIAVLLCNALDANALRGTAYGASGRIEYTRENMAQSKLKIYAGKGTVTHNGVTSLSGGNGGGRGTVTIDNAEVYRAGQTDAAALLGYAVRFHYKTDDATGDNVLLYIEKDFRVDELTIDAEDLAEASPHSVSYYDGGRVRTAGISPNIDILYNAAAVDEFSYELLLPEQGSVTLIDNDGDGVYELALVTAYRNMAVGNTNADSLLVYGKDGFGGELNLSADGGVTVELVGTDGGALAFADIKAGSILSIFESRNEKVKRVIISNARASVTVGEVVRDGSLRLIADGQEYRAARDYSRYLDGKDGGAFSPGQRLTLFLDRAGNFAWHEAGTDTADKIGYWINAKVAPGVGSSVKVKIFTKEGVFETLDCANTVQIDGKPLKEGTAITDVFERFTDAKKTILTGTLMVYRVNQAGELSEIDTPSLSETARESNAALYRTYPGPEGETVNPMTYKTDSKAFGFKILVNDGCPTFVIPTTDVTAAEERFFQIKTLSYYTKDRQYPNIEGYQTRADSFFTTALVLRQNISTSVDTEATLAVVKKISEVSRDGEILCSIRAIKDGNEVTLISAEEDTFTNVKGQNGAVYKNMQIGDVFRYGTQPDGRVNVVQMIMGTAGEREGSNAPEPSKKEKAFNSESNLYAQTNFLLKNVYAKSEGSMLTAELSADLSQITSGNQMASTDIHRVSGYKIVVVEDDGGRVTVRAGKADDILDYKSTEADYSTVLLQTRWGDPRSMVIFRNYR